MEQKNRTSKSQLPQSPPKQPPEVFSRGRYLYFLRECIKRLNRAGCDPPVDPSIIYFFSANNPWGWSPDQHSQENHFNVIKQVAEQWDFLSREEAERFALIYIYLPLSGLVDPVSNPQAEDGHIDIANELAEALARVRIAGNDMRVLWVILRKTWGWHKKTDAISITQLQEATGLPRRHVSRAVSNLLSRNIVTKNGDGFIASYRFQKDYTRWKPVTKNGDKRQTVTKIAPQLSPKMVHTKENNTKEKEKKIGRSKRQTDPRVKEFFAFWSKVFQGETGSPYTFSFAKDGDITKKLLGIHSLDTLRNVAGLFFKDEQCRRRGLTIGIFFQEINRLLGLKAMSPLEQTQESELESEPSLNEMVSEVFSYWQKVMGYPDAKLDPSRKEKIEARLREGRTVKECKKAIDGCKDSSWHMGENKLSRKFDDIELICRDASHFENFLKPEYDEYAHLEHIRPLGEENA